MQLQPRPPTPVRKSSPFDNDITDALVRLAHRMLLPAQLRGARARPADQHRLATTLCQSCIAVQVSGLRPLHLELVSIQAPAEMDPAHAVLLYAYDLDGGEIVGVETLVHLGEDEIDTLLPATQLVARLDELPVETAQQRIGRWLAGFPSR